MCNVMYTIEVVREPLLRECAAAHALSLNTYFYIIYFIFIYIYNDCKCTRQVVREPLLHECAAALRAEAGRAGGSTYDDVGPVERARLLHLLCCELLETDPRHTICCIVLYCIV